MHTASFHTQQAFTHRTLTHSAFTHGKRLHTQKLLHRDAFTESFYTQQAFTEKVFAQRSFLVHNHNRNCSSKTGSRRQSDKKTILKHFLKGILKAKLLAPKLRKSAEKITFAALMQPFQYDLRSSAAKDNSITHAAAAPSNLDAATTMRSAETELRNTIELRAMASEIAAPKPDGSRRQSDKKTILKHFLKGILKGKLLAPKLKKSADKSLSQP